MKFIVVGCGSIGKRHIRNLLACGAEQIIGVDSRPDRRKEAGEYGISTSESLDQILDRGDAVVVALPNSLHRKVVQSAIEAEAHLLVEKPLDVDSQGLEGLIERFNAYGGVGHVGSNFKFHPSFRVMKSIIDDGSLGDILSARALFGQYLPDWHPWEDYREGYSARSELGGGALFDSHEIDYMAWFLGPVSEVACMASKISDLEIDTEDVASVIMRHDSGPQTEIHLDYIHRVYRRRYEFEGAVGNMIWDVREAAVKVYDSQLGIWTVLEEPRGYDPNTMYLEQTRHFLDCLAGKDSPMTPLEIGLQTLRIIEAAKTSSRDKTFVSLQN